MALLAYMPNAACAAPGGAAQAAEAPSASEPKAATEAATGEATPFDRAGMWIWYVDRSEGGNVPRIARAERAGIGTLYVKAGDGGERWSQFSSALVDALQRGGLDACAWQFVYGKRPLTEARVDAAAVRNGADCLVIDAETSYEGRYAAADRCIRALRARIGATFPLSLAVTAVFGPRTAAAVRSFQLSRGLPVDGQVGTDTWPGPLEATPVRPRWSAFRRARARRGATTRGPRPVPASRPLSASLPAHAYEIHPGPAP